MTELNLPESDATVRVRLVDTTGVMVVKAKSFIEPVQPGHELLSLYVAAFLIEHPTSGRKVMFDLGVRKEYWKLPAAMQKRLGHVIQALRVDQDTTEILQQNGIALSDISSVIWSHYHWDHTGSMELFPPSTELVVGEGFKASPSLLPPFPHNPESPIDGAAIADRALTEVEFGSTGLMIGGFRAKDFFGDGSFYLLDTPGHCVGHMCGLARTTGGPNSTFILLGGDICHFPGVFRPSTEIPLPDTIFDGTFQPMPCPCTLLTDQPGREPLGTGHDGVSFETKALPMYRVSTEDTAAYLNSSIAQQSVDKLVSFDGSPSVLVCLAHDESMLHNLPTFNDSPSDDLNNWKERGYKKKIHWGWLNSLPRDGKPAQEVAVEGFWRNGTPWPEAQSVLRENGSLASKITL